MKKEFNIKIDYFEGPFDLLLKLVNQQKLDIKKISISSIIDQYLESVSTMQKSDLDMSSDFMLVAATLLKIKTDSILKLQLDDIQEDIDSISSLDAYQNLKSKLLVYKQYSDASKYLIDLSQKQANLIPRNTGPDPEFIDIAPDYLKNIKIADLTAIAATCFARRDQFLLDSKHIASKPIPVSSYVKKIHSQLLNKNNMSFSEIVDNCSVPEIVVVNFLAILELYKRNYIDISQISDTDDISIKLLDSDQSLDLSDKDLEEIQ